MSMVPMPQDKPFEITGRMVFWAMVAFFGMITIVNVVMIWIALTSFTGIEATNAYEAGRNFNQSIAAAKQQHSDGWQAQADYDRGKQRLVVRLRDAANTPIGGLALDVHFRNPTTAQRDRSVTLSEGEVGVYKASVPALDDGQWDMVIEARRDDDVVYTSRNRVTLR